MRRTTRDINELWIVQNEVRSNENFMSDVKRVLRLAKNSAANLDINDMDSIRIHVRQDLGSEPERVRYEDC